MSLIPFLMFCAVTTQQPLTAHGEPGSDPSTQPLLIYFSGENCSPCNLLDQLFQEPETLQKMESQFVSVRVSINESVGKACAEIYHIQQIPAFVIADHKGSILFKSEAASPNDLQYLLDHGKETPEAPVTQNIQKEPATQLPMASVTSPAQPSQPAVSKQEFQVQAVALKSDEKGIEAAAIKAVEPTSEPEPVAEAKPSLTPKTPPTPKKPQTTTRVYAYSIQLGYFSELANAEKLEHTAITKGLTKAFTQHETHGGKAFYRVMVGKTTSLTEAQKILEEVHRLGLKGAVYRK